MILSILICSLDSRKELLAGLLVNLQNQIAGKDVEILVDLDSGQKTIGFKRNSLLNQAVGEYCCFVDDDDSVSPDYVDKIILALEQKPDCCGIEGILHSKIQGNYVFKHSISFAGWYTSASVFYRSVNHLNPIKTVIARSVGFDGINNGEDRMFSDRVKKFLKKEVYIKNPIYIYNVRY